MGRIISNKVIEVIDTYYSCELDLYDIILKNQNDLYIISTKLNKPIFHMKDEQDILAIQDNKIRYIFIIKEGKKKKRKRKNIQNYYG